MAMRTLLHCVALLGAAALQKQSDPRGIEEKVNNIEEIMANKENETIEEIVTEIRRQKDEYQRRLVGQRDRIQAVQADNQAMYEKIKPTQESIEELYANASGAFQDSKALTRTLKDFEHNISLAHEFVLDGISLSERKLQLPGLEILNEVAASSKAPLLSNGSLSKLLIERNSTGVQEVMARLAGGAELEDKPEIGSQLTDSFEHLMKETDQYYEDLVNEQSAMQEKLDAIHNVKSKLAHALKNLTSVRSNMVLRVNALHALSDTLSGVAELPSAIQQFEAKSMAKKEKEEAGEQGGQGTPPAEGGEGETPAEAEEEAAPTDGAEAEAKEVVESPESETNSTTP